MIRKKNILAYLPLHIRPRGIGYAAHSLSIGMNQYGLNSEIISIRNDMASSTKHVYQGVPSKLIYSLRTKFQPFSNVIELTEARFKNLAKKYEMIHLWPGSKLSTIEELKSHNKMIIIENINCHQLVSKRILDKESKRLGTQVYNFTDEDIAYETKVLSLADFVFSPSPQVTSSLIEANVSREKILESSYGLGINALIPSPQIENKKSSQFTALFVGSVIARKGVHLLLDYWCSANINGKLKIIGKVAPHMEEIIAQYENVASIEFIPYTSNLYEHYATADIFVMPSLEEGSPLVTYLAIGAGLPCLVSPMAGDGVIRNDNEGYIIEPHDREAWIENLKWLFDDITLRRRLAINSRERAEYFLWDNVASRRAKQILDI